MAISLNDTSAIFAAMRVLSMTRLMQVQNAAAKAADAAAAADKVQAAAQAAARSTEHAVDVTV